MQTQPARVPRSIAERAVAVVMGLAMVGVSAVFGLNEILYALRNPGEELSLALLVPVALIGYCGWVVSTPRRSPGWPIALIVLSFVGACAVLGTLYVVALARGFNH